MKALGITFDLAVAVLAMVGLIAILALAWEAFA